MERAYSQEFIENIKNAIQQRLSPARFEHSVIVAEIAEKYSKTVGIDESRAVVAGLLHDIAREYTNEQLEETAKKYEVKLTKFNIAFPPSIHGKVGSAIAKKDFGIDDEEILLSISNHVSGRPCMKTLEQIIYLADHIARSHKTKPDVEEDITRETLEESLFRVLGRVIEYDTKNKKPIDERTLQTFDWLLEKINDKDHVGPVDLPEPEMAKFYDRMDDLLEISVRHSILSLPAENIRDLGGYSSSDGRAIRKNKILRSGSIEKFTDKDFEVLKKLGINYIVDLRTDSEKSNKLNIASYGINYAQVPFDKCLEIKSYLEVLVKWYKECDDQEESAWLTAKYFEAFDIDGMYKSLLFDSKLSSKYKTILDIMLSDDCNGVLFFCESGKDRTGIISAMVMSALNIDNKTILDDYMVSQVPYYSITMNYLNKLKKNDYNLDVQNQVISVLGVESERPIKLNQEILNKYKDYKQYFDFESMYGVDDVKKFRDKYLE